jgi:adenylate kinase
MEKFCPPDAVVYLKCDLQTVLSRLCTRRVCPKCNFTTNTRSDAIARKGICAECGTQLITRSDDTPNTITNRYRVFEANNNGIIDYYNKKQILKTINAAHPVKFVINAATTLFKKLIK